ncbi:putative quinol monooxygenase [Roseateles amylovorans]|uniref:putative quinol monooxygenase n=1 Tax=Roseateles amylovorans TaxID=2978473 RepID=UPI003F49AF9E
MSVPIPHPASASSDSADAASPDSSTRASGAAVVPTASRYLQVIAHYHVKPGLGDRVSELLGELTAATRQEPKNLGYDFYRSPQDPDRFVILERYTDASGLDDHRAAPHFQRLGFGTIIPMLVSRQVQSFEVSVNGDGVATAVQR